MSEQEGFQMMLKWP